MPTNCLIQKEDWWRRGARPELVDAYLMWERAIWDGTLGLCGFRRIEERDEVGTRIRWGRQGGIRWDRMGYGGIGDGGMRYGETS